MIRSLVSSPEGVKVIPARPLMQLKAFANRDHFHLANPVCKFFWREVQEGGEPSCRVRVPRKPPSREEPPQAA